MVGCAYIETPLHEGRRTTIRGALEIQQNAGGVVVSYQHYDRHRPSVYYVCDDVISEFITSA